MAQLAWKKSSKDDSVDNPSITYRSFQAAKKFFAVDNSGSTYGSRIRAEGRAVFGIHSNDADTVIKWDHQCSGVPELVDHISSRYFEKTGGGTSPVAILKHNLAVQEIETSDIWCLLTDGLISPSDVTELTQLADKRNLTHIPVILMIVGGRTLTPEETNISVGVPFYANTQEAVILFKDDKSGEIFVIAAKGSFSPLTANNKEASSMNLSNWESLPCFKNESSFMQILEDLAIKVISSNDRRITSAVSLGISWEAATQSLVDVENLLEQIDLEPGDLYNLLEEEAINMLALICKTRNRLQDLRSLLIRHKQIDTVVCYEDRHGATKILEDMQSSDLTQEMNTQLRARLRDAHAANIAAYFNLVNSPSESVKKAREINRLINRGLAILADTEKSGYTADLVSRKSNRARRAEMIASGDADMHLASLELSGCVDAFRDNCSICCGEGQIMSVVLKRLNAVEDNTTDFALNFPLAAGQGKQNDDMISAQLICFQCALICQNSIFKEDLSAVLPTVAYEGVNKAYINHQLTLAITGGLSTGASGVGQIFMTILDRTLETKNWCSDQSHVESTLVDQEQRTRRHALTWLLHTFLKNCITRENFNETGKWVAYPQALTWAIDDFQQTRLDSWAIQYPLAGFNQLMRWYEILKLELPQAVLENLLETKLIHHTVTVFMACLLRKKDQEQAWRNSFLGLIYGEFNAADVPQDRGLSSVLGANRFWSRLEIALGQRSDVRQFLSLFGDVAKTKMCRKIQLITFWALFTQKGHTTPKSFFQTITLREPLAPMALDMKVELPESTVMDILLSIFCPTINRTNINHNVEFCPPFVSPFGASVLKCGHPGCRVKFYSQEDIHPVNPDAIRKKRAQHLKQLFGVSSEFNASETGLPERVTAPVPPSSNNCNLHISIARVWSKLARKLEIGGERISLHKSWGSPTQNFPLSKEAVMKGSEEAIIAFIAEVLFEICAVNHRGNIYQENIEADVREVLPSFFGVLRVASEKLGLEDHSGLAYEHDWNAGNRLQAKIEYELSL